MESSYGTRCAFLTGTDEHGLKVQRAAEEHGALYMGKSELWSDFKKLDEYRFLMTISFEQELPRRRQEKPWPVTTMEMSIFKLMRVSA